MKISPAVSRKAGPVDPLSEHRNMACVDGHLRLEKSSKRVVTTKLIELHQQVQAGGLHKQEYWPPSQAEQVHPSFCSWIIAAGSGLR